MHQGRSYNSSLVYYIQERSRASNVTSAKFFGIDVDQNIKWVYHIEADLANRTGTSLTRPQSSSYRRDAAQGEMGTKKGSARCDDFECHTLKRTH